MQIRPGRTQSLIGGIAALAVMIVGLVIMSSFNTGLHSIGFGNPGGANAFGNITSIFMIVWVLFGLIGAGVSFYNAFSEKGVPTYEIDLKNQGNSSFCPQCGKPIGDSDRFCKHCGSELE